MLKEFTKILLLLPGLGEEGFTQATLLARQRARGDGDKRHPSCSGHSGVLIALNELHCSWIMFQDS